jgi:hypothetical protein
MVDYYSILGLPRGASKAQIKTAYRKLALQWHPDRNPSPGARQKFIQITEAYDALMEGKTFSFSRPFKAEPPKPKAKTEKDVRKEKILHEYELLQKKFLEIRRYYNSPLRRAKLHKEEYDWIKRMFILSASIFLAGILLPIIVQSMGVFILTFPLGLGFGVRFFFKAGRRKMKADMIFGKEEHYSRSELRDFFAKQVSMGIGSWGGNSGPSWDGY